MIGCDFMLVPHQKRDGGWNTETLPPSYILKQEKTQQPFRAVDGGQHYSLLSAENRNILEPGVGLSLFLITGTPRYRPLQMILSIYGCAIVFHVFIYLWKYQCCFTAVVRVWADQVRGGGGVGDHPCIKIGYSSRLVPRAEKGPQPMY